MRKLLALLFLISSFAGVAHAQVVGQGSSGAVGDPWYVTGTVTFSNTTINIGAALPAGGNTIGAVNLAQYTPNVGRLPVYLGDVIGTRSATTDHTDSIQIGGTTTAGNEWNAAQVTAADPLQNANALVVRNLSATGTPGVSAPTLWNVVGGRDPVTNALRQMDLKTSDPVGTENGIIVRNLPSGTQAVSGTVTFSNTTIDITDRAARLVGRVYGSQGQQLKQTATDFNLGAELYTGATAYDARQIRALTSADAVTAFALSNLTQVNSVNVASPFDVDTSAGTQSVQGFSLRKSASGGSVEYGTSSDPIRIDPTGTTIQPISATSLPLPTGAATETGNLAKLDIALTTLRDAIIAAVQTSGKTPEGIYAPVPLTSGGSAVTVATVGGVKPVLKSPFQCNAVRKTNCSSTAF